MRSWWLLTLGLFVCVGESCAANDDCGPTSDWPAKTCSSADSDDGDGEGMAPTGPSIDAGSSGSGTKRDAGSVGSCFDIDAGMPGEHDAGDSDAGPIGLVPAGEAGDAGVPPGCPSR